MANPSMQLFSPFPTASAYLESLRNDLEGARVLRFVIAYVSDSGLTSIGQELLAAALQHPDSFGVASLSCSCGFGPFVGLQKLLEPQQNKLKYFVDPVVMGTEGDPELALVHSKLVYIVRSDNRAVVYLGSHNWSGRALGPGSPRNAEASMRFEFEYEPAQLAGQGADLPSEVNRHLLECFQLGACLPVHGDNIPIFADWFRARCEREESLPLDQYAVILGICAGVEGAAYEHLWKALLTPGASIYLPCHIEEEGQILRKNQDRVLLMAWLSEDSLRRSEEPVLLFCKVTRQVAGKESELEGTSEGDIENFHLVLHDDEQNQRAADGQEPGDSLFTDLNNSQRFEYFRLNSVHSSVTAATIDGDASPRYQSYLQVYEVLLPEWLKGSENFETVAARERLASAPAQAVWSAANLALTTNPRVQPEAAKNYRVPEQTRNQIMDCFADFFGLDQEQLRVRPIDPNVPPRDLVRMAQSRVHYGYISDADRFDGDAFYEKVRPGRLAPDLEHMGQGEAEESAVVERRVQQLYAERLREILENVGIEDPDLTAWEAKPPKRKSRTIETVRLNLFDIGGASDVERVAGDIHHRHSSRVLSDRELVREVLLLAVSVQDVGLAAELPESLCQHLFEQACPDQSNHFFAVLFVQNLEQIAHRHVERGGRSVPGEVGVARREVKSFLRGHHLGDDRVWEFLAMEYLRGVQSRR